MMVNREKIIFSYERLAARIKKGSEDRAKVHTYLQEIANDTNVRTVARFGLALEYTLLKLYSGVDFEVAPGIDLVKLSQHNHLIFVPNHQSHADYLVFSYVLHRRLGIVPAIAGGVNLNVFPIGNLFRKSGCFFIRRSFNSNILYKLTLEAYVYYLLWTGQPIEFFYEGGRSRTGKLMPPKFGLFQILLEAHKLLPANQKKPLLFVPVSIVHELVPEQGALSQEMLGAKKSKESFAQLLKLYRFVTKKFGTIHIKIGRPITACDWSSPAELKNEMHEIAFRCYRRVGKGMKLSPSSVLILLLLDEPICNLTWDEILQKARQIIDYCRQLHIPLAQTLLSSHSEEGLSESLELLQHNKKIVVLENRLLDKVFYSINESSRVELLYSKNVILHHFLAPHFIQCCLQAVRAKQVQSVEELKAYLLEQQELLKYEFQLPKLREIYLHAALLISHFCQRRLRRAEDLFDLSSSDLQRLEESLTPFSQSFRYIFETYFIALLTFSHLNEVPFTRDRFLKVSREVFEMERKHGRIVRYSESYTHPAMLNALNFFCEKGVVENREGRFWVGTRDLLEYYKNVFARKLTDQILSGLRTPF